MNSPYRLPPAYPDELWYSRVARYHRHSGNIYKATSREELFGKEYPTTLNPFGVDRTLTLYQLRHGGDIEELCIKNTLAPFILRYYNAERKSKFIETLADLGKNFEMPKLIGRNKKKETLRYCPLCCKEDKAQYGEMYWHRQHQIYFVPICAKHHCRTIPYETSYKSLLDSLACADEDTCNNQNPVYEESVLLPYIDMALNHPFSFRDTTPVDAIVAELLWKNYAGKKYEPNGAKVYLHQKELYGRMENLYGSDFIQFVFSPNGGKGDRLGSSILGNVDKNVERVLTVAAAVDTSLEKLFLPIENIDEYEKVKEKLVQMSNSGYRYSKKKILEELNIPEWKLKPLVEECGIEPFWQRNKSVENGEAKINMGIRLMLRRDELRAMNDIVKEMKVFSLSEYIHYCIRKDLQSRKEDANE